MKRIKKKDSNKSGFILLAFTVVVLLVMLVFMNFNAGADHIYDHIHEHSHECDHAHEEIHE
jgi:uncharacterized membrane protein